MNVKTALITSRDTAPIVSVHRDEDSIRSLLTGNYLSQLLEDGEDEDELSERMHRMPFDELITFFETRGGFEIQIEDHPVWQ